MNDLRAKMRAYVENGALLGVLLDPELPGFVLDISGI